MRIIMGKVHRDRTENITRRQSQPRRPARPAARNSHAASRSSSGKGKGKGIFILLGAAFLATFLIGLHEGMATHLAAASHKAAVLSAQMSYPQGGKTVAAREMQKLQGIFAQPSETTSIASAASGK